MCRFLAGFVQIVVLWRPFLSQGKQDEADEQDQEEQVGQMGKIVFHLDKRGQEGGDVDVQATPLLEQETGPEQAVVSGGLIQGKRMQDLVDHDKKRVQGQEIKKPMRSLPSIFPVVYDGVEHE